jgi:hypothetical protein
VRPVVPDKDLRDWIGKGARPGLPEITPNPIASAPSFREGNDRRNRIAIPSGEIIRRPVVTRNRPKDSETGISAPRERRLILPRTPVYTGDPSGRKERNNGRSENRSPKPPVIAPGEKQNQDDSNRVIRVPRPDQADSSERKAKRDREDSNLQRPGDKPEKNADTDDSSKERQRKQPIYLPAPKENNPPSEKPRDAEDRQREKKPRDEARPRPREDASPHDDSRPRSEERRSEERPKPRERVDPPPRPQPPPSENKSQPREERQQQKEERRQERREERREERKKP